MSDVIISAKVTNLSGNKMETPEEVDRIIELYRLGWGKKRIARELGISVNTVRRYVAQGGWAPYCRSNRPKKCTEVQAWIDQAFMQHRGNAEVVRQELQKTHKISVSLRTVERAVQPLRKRLKAEDVATMRFETPPGQQLQIDFGEMIVQINDKKERVYLFVATLGFSRRVYVQAFRHSRQQAWFRGLEGAFRHFEGIPQQVLVDNAKPLVASHDAQTREVTFNERFKAFCCYWNVIPKACAPYRARTKGKAERAIQYVKNNGIAGRDFTSWADLEGHLMWWMREVADTRTHQTTLKRPIDSYSEVEKQRLTPLGQRPSFISIRELRRVVQNDACVEIDCNYYSVPWRLIREELLVQVTDEEIRMFRSGQEVARHVVCRGVGQRQVSTEHLDGVITGRCSGHNLLEVKSEPSRATEPTLLRSLLEYQDAVGGRW